MHTHAKSALGLWAIMVLGALALSPAPLGAAEKPAVIKPMGMTIPNFFFSASERRAREACDNDLAECRTSVRLQLEQEMEYSLIIPWIILGAGILGSLLWLRAQEQKKALHRRKAQRHHDPKAYRKLGKTSEEKAEEAARQRQREELAED